MCLPEKKVETYAGERATVIGWGKTSGKQSFSSARVLQELGVTVVSQEECQKQWSYGKGRVEIGGPKMSFKSDGSSCQGDSGGGMFLKKNEQRSLIGVCSYGLADCQNWAPEVYTKVNSFAFLFVFIIICWQVSFVLDWIKKVVDGDELNIYKCGVVTARAGQGKGSWKEMGKKFFEGRQVWR